MRSCHSEKGSGAFWAEHSSISNVCSHCSPLSIILETLAREARSWRDVGSTRSCRGCFSRYRRKRSCCKQLMSFLWSHGQVPVNSMPPLAESLQQFDRPHHQKPMLPKYPRRGANRGWWQYHFGEFADPWCTQWCSWNVLYSFGIINKIKGSGLPGTWPYRLCSCFQSPSYPQVMLLRNVFPTCLDSHLSLNYHVPGPIIHASCESLRTLIYKYV